MSPDRLVYMANQIGKFFATQRGADAVEGIVAHLTKFWDPSMRLALIAQLRDGHADALDPLPRQAIEKLAGGN